MFALDNKKEGLGLGLEHTKGLCNSKKVWRSECLFRTKTSCRKKKEKMMKCDRLGRKFGTRITRIKNGNKTREVKKKMWKEKNSITKNVCSKKILQAQNELQTEKSLYKKQKIIRKQHYTHNATHENILLEKRINEKKNILYHSLT